MTLKSQHVICNSFIAELQMQDEYSCGIYLLFTTSKAKVQPYVLFQLPETSCDANDNI